MKKTFWKLLFAVAFILASVGPAVSQTWSDKLTSTPIRIQDGYGSAGNGLPYNGLLYCVPTSATMSMQYLGNNGFTQLSSANSTSAESLNLTRVLGGLMNTDAYNFGTSGSGRDNGFRDYLAAKGISTANYNYGYVSLNTSSAISLLAAANVNQTMLNLEFGLYSTGSSPTRQAGHIVTLVGQGLNAQGQASNTIAINNPQPSIFLPSPDTTAAGRQYLNLVPTTGALTAFGGTRLDTAQASGSWAHSQTVLEAYTYLTVDASQLVANNPTAATWNLSTTKTLNTNGGDLTVLAPLAGAGGVAKSGTGTLTLTAANTTTGVVSISNGTLASTVSSGRPFGSGSFTATAGSVSIAPTGTGGVVSLTGADGTGATFTYGTLEQMILDRGSRSSLTFTVGGNTNGITPNLVRSANGTLVLSPASGVSTLGTSEKFLVNGSGGNLPTSTNGMVSPGIVARDPSQTAVGDFLNYGGNGFVKATYTSATTVPINASTASTVYDANIAQTLTVGSTANMYALKVSGVTINGAGGTTTVQVGLQSLGTQAGLIFNGGTIATSALSFGAAEALVYTGQQGGTIAAAVQGSGSLVKFGSGSLTVTGASQYTGTVYVQQGTLIAGNASGSATGTGPVNIGPAGTLQINGGTSTGTSSGTFAQSGGTLRMNGGTLTGPLTMNSGSYLTGSGTIAGTTSLNGAITGLTNLTFTGPVASSGTMTYSWRLNALDDTAAGAGTSYSQLRFNNGTQTILGANSANGFYLNFDLADGLADPNSNDPFWGQSHSWTVMKASPWFNTLWYRGAGFPEFSHGDFSIAFDSGFTSMNVVYTPVPEPSWSLAIAGTGIACFGILRWLRRRSVTPTSLAELAV